MARELDTNYVRTGELRVANALHDFIGQEAAPGTGITAEAFWSGFAGALVGHSQLAVLGGVEGEGGAEQGRQRLRFGRHWTSRKFLAAFL
jgi:hypothetical protein